ncbi:MAG: RHS repeat-associated core domain-containing protein [Thermoanaerobaculia bacterium]
MQRGAARSAATTYDCDALGNLRKVVLPDGRIVEYVIDAQNRRVGKKINGILAKGWLYSNQLRIAAELDGGGTIISRFVYVSRSNVPDFIIRGGVSFRILSDHLGSPRYVLDATTGAVIQSLDYDEFGRVLADSNPGFQPFGFAGGLLDYDTGLVRFGARDYDPHTGRWTAKDPILFGGGDANLYGYVFADPINLIDRTGASAEGALNSLKDLFGWTTGNLPPESAADPSSAAELANTPGAENIRRVFVKNGCKSGRYSSDYQYSELTNTRNVTGQIVGGFVADVRIIGGGQIVIKAFNTWGLESATRLPGRSNRGNPSVQDMVNGAPLMYPKSILNDRTGPGAMTNAKLNYIWTEANPCDCP